MLTRPIIILKEFREYGQSTLIRFGGKIMFRELRRKDRALSTDEAKAFLEKEECGVLSVLGDDGYPYGVPVNYAFADNCIYIHGFLEGHKMDAVKKYPKVCFTVFGDTEVLPVEISTNYTSVILFGNAEVIPLENETERKTALEAILFKYCEDNESTNSYLQQNKAQTNVIKITIEHMAGKRRRSAV